MALSHRREPRMARAKLQLWGPYAEVAVGEWSVAEDRRMQGAASERAKAMRRCANYPRGLRK